MTRRIVACGGQQLAYPALTSYVFALARRQRPKVLLLPTASGDSPGYLLSFYQAMAGVDCVASHLDLFQRTVGDIAALIVEQDVVVVSGGNTANMLAIWRVHGVERALRDAYAAGTVLTGWSAGCICWFESGITDSFSPDLGVLNDGLGILGGSACPHYDGEERRRPVYTAAVRDGLAPGIALEDGVAARYDDERLVEVVSGRPDGHAFRVEPGGEHPTEVRQV